MNREDIAYCAGLYEGEGYVSAAIRLRTYSRKPDPRMQLKIVMTDVGPLHIFADTFDVGNIYGPYEQKGKNTWKDKYDYSLYRFEYIQFVIAAM